MSSKPDNRPKAPTHNHVWSEQHQAWVKPKKDERAKPKKEPVEDSIYRFKGLNDSWD